jgi:hypothetical protein
MKDPLLELNKLLTALPKSCLVYVMGGLALDGTCGSISRKHDDADLICWRKDVGIVQEAVRNIGYEIEVNTFPDEPNLPYRFETTDEDHMVSFNIIDEAPNDSFVMSFYHFPKQVFQKKLLGPISVSLDGIGFSAVSHELLDKLNKNAGKYLNDLKERDPDLYNRLGYKIDNYNHDRKLLDQLAKK